MSYFNLISILETEDCIADIIGALRALESHKDHARLPHDLILFGSRKSLSRRELECISKWDFHSLSYPAVLKRNNP